MSRHLIIVFNRIKRVSERNEILLPDKNGVYLGVIDLLNGSHKKDISVTSGRVGYFGGGLGAGPRQWGRVRPTL